MAPAPRGWFGKLPSRGDFLRAGLPRRFTDPLDVWLQAALTVSRAALGEAWTEAWLEAPVWRFSLPAGACGPDPAIGVMLPSVDRAGRYFPLILVRLAAPDEDAARFLAAAEQAGLAALAADHVPHAIGHALTTIPDCIPPLPLLPNRGALWWTEGSPRRPSLRFTVPGLPAPAGFAAMLDSAAGDPC